MAADEKAEAPMARHVIFMYTTEHLEYKDKVRFYYGLKGRDGKSGIIKKAGVDQLGKTVLLVSNDAAPSVETFLTGWKCVFKRKTVLVPQEDAPSEDRPLHLNRSLPPSGTKRGRHG